MTIQQAVNMNNNAIAEMLAGSLAASVDLLRAALSVLKEQIDVPAPSSEVHGGDQMQAHPKDEPASPKDDYGHHRPPQPLAHLRRVASEPSLSQSSAREHSPHDDCSMELTVDPHDRNDDDSQQTFLYIRSVAVTSVDSLTPCTRDATFLPVYDRALFVESCSPTEEGQDSLAAVLLFNLGLVYHLRGTYRGQSSSLRKSLHFYKLALDVVETSTSFRYPKNQSILLPLALLYNTAQVDGELIVLDEMHECLCQLRNRISNDLQTLYSTLNREDYAFLFMNTMLSCVDGQEIMVTAPAA